jgi:hypothetical protein
MTKSTKLSKSDIIKIKASIKAAGENQKKIKDRINYIVKYIGNVFGCHDNYWSLVHYSHEDDSQNLDLKSLDYKSKFIELDADFYTDDEFGIYFFDKNTTPSDKNSIDLSDGFPKRWLFEDFETELVVGRRKYRSWCHKKIKKRRLKLRKLKRKPT